MADLFASHKIEISGIELLALKKLAIINKALADKFDGETKREQMALVKVLVEVLNRAEYEAPAAAARALVKEGETR